MRNKKAIVGGKEMSFTYDDCQKEMDLINRAFIEVITEGDAKGRVFTFPIPTYNVTNDFNWDNDNATLLFEMTAKYGIPYFQNFINSELKPGDVRSMCCRLQMDMRELRQKGGGLFGAVEMTGSVGVVTINLPRIGYLSKTKEEFFERLSKLMDISRASLEIKRKLVQRNMDNGLMPFTKRYLGTLQNHFNTIGINGMNEALQNFFGADVNMSTKRGIAFTEEVLDFMRDRLKKFQEETGNIYNLEATPAEGVSYRFAKIDKERYPDMISSGKENPFYTNSTQLPVNYTTDIFEALELQDGLQIKYTGGTVLHGFLGERVTDVETCKKLVKRIAYNFRLPYLTITPTFSVCPKHGYIPGRHESCPYEDSEGEKNSGEIKPAVYS
jgi:ribonucleoside-triphosphate reductase